MTYVRTLATSTYQGGQKRIDFRPEAIKTAEQKAEQAKAVQARKDAKADAKARLEARQRAHLNRNGFITFKDPSTGKYVSGTPADLSAARRKAQQEAAQARKNFKGHVTEVSPFDGSKQSVTPETAEYWRSQKKVVGNKPAPAPKPTPAPKPLPTPKPKPGFLGNLGKFAKKLGKWGIPLALLAGGLYLLKDCKGCSNSAPVAPAPEPVAPKESSKATVKEDIKEAEIKNVAYKMQAGDRFDKVIEAKYGITDPELNKKVREYIREQMGMPKSGRDENGKTVIPRIEQDGKTLYDAYFLPEVLPEDLGGAKYQDNEVQKSQYPIGDNVSQEAKDTTRVEKTSDGFSVIKTTTKADGTEETSVVASGLTEEQANQMADEINNN